MPWPPDDCLRLTTIDAHTGGEPLRIVTGGWPAIPGTTMLDKRAFARAYHDHLRRALMWEPRGHADMYGCIPTDPVTDDGHAGVLFLHNEGFSTMCGHGVIALVTVGLDAGWLRSSSLPDGRALVRLDTPAGRVTATAERGPRGVMSVAFENVPSFVAVRDLGIEVPDLGRLRCDIAFGGAYYAYVETGDLGFPLDLVPSSLGAIIELGRLVKRVVSEHVPLVHPDGAGDLGFLYGTILVQPLDGWPRVSRNVCVFADGEVDRSPTGTGVSGRVAIHHARGELAVGERLVVESLVGSRFEGRLVRTTNAGVMPAVVPEVQGSASLTGRHEFVIDPEDPFKDGFLLR